MHEKLEKLKHDLYVGEQKLRATENEALHNNLSGIDTVFRVAAAYCGEKLYYGATNNGKAE